MVEGETPGEVEGKVEGEEKLTGVGGEEGVEGLEELEAVMVVLPPPFPWLASPRPQPQLSLPSPLPPHLFLLLFSPLLLPLASVPASSNKGPLLVQIQLFFGKHPASFPHVDLDPDLIQLPRTVVPSSLFWPLKQT